MFFVSCGTNKPVKFNPDFWRHDYKKDRIVSERGDYVYCDKKKFNEFASMHITKIKELAKILRRAVVPSIYKSNKSKILRDLDNLVSKITKSNH